MYIRLDENNIVREIIPDIDPVFPGVSIEKRYPPDFVAKLMYVEDSTEVAQNLMYDEATGTFVEPPEPEPVESAPDPEPEQTEPTADELLKILAGVSE